MIEELELSEDQVRDILDTELFFRTKRSALKAELRNLQLAMEQVCLASDFDKLAVMRLAEKIGDLKKMLYLEKTESRLAIRHLLTSEQIKKLRLYRMQQANCQKQGDQSNMCDFSTILPVRYLHSKKMKLSQQGSCQ